VYTALVEGFAAQGPLLFAHRGAPGDHVENTLPSFWAALAYGADVLEMDVRMSADGHVVVHHDVTGERVFGDPRAIHATRYADIKSWRVRGASGQMYEPAGLAEVLEAFPHAALNVDVKQERPDMLANLLDLIMGHAAEERVLLTSFSARTLTRIRSLGYHGPLGMSRRDVALFLLGPRLPNLLPRFGAQRLQVPVSYGGLNLATRANIERVHAAGLRIDYWVVNNPVQAEHLLDLGADGIVTDDAASLARVYARHVRTRGFRARRAGEGSDPTANLERGLPANHTLTDVFEARNLESKLREEMGEGYEEVYRTHPDEGE
jgi:glycerophosphoryl diester phosphodiesterase